MENNIGSPEQKENKEVLEKSIEKAKEIGNRVSEMAGSAKKKYGDCDQKTKNSILALAAGAAVALIGAMAFKAMHKHKKYCCHKHKPEDNS